MALFADIIRHQLLVWWRRSSTTINIVVCTDNICNNVTADWHSRIWTVPCCFCSPDKSNMKQKHDGSDQILIRANYTDFCSLLALVACYLETWTQAKGNRQSCLISIYSVKGGWCKTSLFGPMLPAAVRRTQSSIKAVCGKKMHSIAHCWLCLSFWWHDISLNWSIQYGFFTDHQGQDSRCLCY